MRRSIPPFDERFAEIVISKCEMVPCDITSRIVQLAAVLSVVNRPASEAVGVTVLIASPAPFTLTQFFRASLPSFFENRERGQRRELKGTALNTRDVVACRPAMSRSLHFRLHWRGESTWIRVGRANLGLILDAEGWPSGRWRWS
jgi:hypothetical protein